METPDHYLILHPNCGSASGRAPQAACPPGSHPQAAHLPGSSPKAAHPPGSPPQAAHLPGSPPQAAHPTGSPPPSSPSPRQPTPQAVHPPWQLQPSLTASFTYKDKFVIICLNIFEYGLKQQEKRKAELETFMECVQEAIQENQEQGKLTIAKFEEKHLLVGPTPSPPPAAGAHLPEAQPLPSDDPSPLVIVPVHQFTSSGFYLPHPLRLLHCPRLTVGSPRPFASVVSLPRWSQQRG